MNSQQQNLPPVFFTRNIVPENLVKLYDVLNKPLPGKIGIKIHSGEHDKSFYIQPKFMRPLVFKTVGTILEANTGYPGKRMYTEDHWKLLAHHGFTTYFKCDILDADEEMAIPVNGGKILKENFVGKHLEDYDSLVILSHFKGHEMGGFGGALKNISIGLASSKGKLHIHGAGNADKAWSTPQDPFCESMADACKSIIEYMKGNMVYINVMKDMSIDCDCNNNPKDPEMADIGMLSSVDPVALDQACIDLVYNSNDPGKESLIKRIEELHGIHTIESAELLGLGSRKYQLVDLDN